MDSMKKKYYLTEVLRTRCGNTRGRIVIAKPLYILSLIEAIERGVLKDNIINVDNQQLLFLANRNKGLYTNQITDPHKEKHGRKYFE